MNAVFKASMLALLCVIALSSVAQADSLLAPMISDPKFSFLSTLNGDSIILKYNPESVTNVVDIMTDANAVHEDVTNVFANFTYPVTVIVAGDDSEMKLLINAGDAPDTMEGLNWNSGYNGIILIKYIQLKTTRSDFKQVLTHQMARIAIRSELATYKNNLPKWYQDGLASYVAGDVTQEQRNNATMMAATGRWMTPDELENAYNNMTIYNYDDELYSNARAEAWTMAGEIDSICGSRKMIEIIDDYTVNGNFSLAFYNQTGFTPEGMSTFYRNLISGVDNQQDGVTTGTVYGYMLNTDGNPVAGRTFTLAGLNGNVTATTGTGGYYTINVTEGIYQIFAPDGTFDGSVNVDAGQIVRQNVTIAAVPATTGTATSASAHDTSDLVFYVLIGAVNVVGLLVVVAILRRNWH